MQGSNSITSLNVGDYAQYEPELRTAGLNSLKTFSKVSLIGPKGGFDTNQAKLYLAVK